MPNCSYLYGVNKALSLCLLLPDPDLNVLSPLIAVLYHMLWFSSSYLQLEEKTDLQIKASHLLPLLTCLPIFHEHCLLEPSPKPPHFQNHKGNTSKDSSQIFHKQFTRVKPTCLLPFEPYQNKSNLNLVWSCRFCSRVYLLLTFFLIICLIAVFSSGLLIPKLTKVSF